MNTPRALFVAVLLARGATNAGVNAPTSTIPTPTPTVIEPKQISRRVPDNGFMWRGCSAHGIPTVAFIVNPEGTTSGHRVLHTSGCASADRIYVSFVRRFWRYAPGLVNGTPVSTEVTITTTIDPT